MKVYVFVVNCYLLGETDAKTYVQGVYLDKAKAQRMADAFPIGLPVDTSRPYQVGIYERDIIE